MRLEFHFFSGLPLQLLNGNRLGVEFFDFVGGRSGDRRLLFDFHQSLGDGFTVGLPLSIERLGIGIDREETALRGGTRK